MVRVGVPSAAAVRAGPVVVPVVMAAGAPAVRAAWGTRRRAMALTLTQTRAVDSLCLCTCAAAARPACRALRG